MIEDKTKMTTMACLRYCFMESDERIPNFAKKYTMIGSSNTIPLANVTEVTVEINEERSILFTTLSLTVYVAKTLTEKGEITK